MATPIEPQDGELAGQLFAAAQKRQNQLLVQLADLYRESLRSLAARELGRYKLEGASVSSAVQESMLRVVRNADWFEGSSLAEFESWLATILRNVIRDRHRYRSAKKRNAAIEIPLAELDSHIFWQCRRPGKAAAAEDEEHGHRWEIVRRSLEKLPPHYQAVIRSHYEQGESVDQLAGRLGSSKSSVRMLIQRAIKRLKTEVAREIRGLS